jgi:hypothetical protein
MAHYAFLDETNIVTEVIVGKDEGEDGIDWEVFYGDSRGQTCKRTSYNTLRNTHSTGGVPLRGNYAGIGYTYDEALDAFIPPQPFASWQFHEETVSWEPPIPRPEEPSRWDEETLSWVPLPNWPPFPPPSDPVE